MKTTTKDEQIIFQNQSRLVMDWFTTCGICADILDINMVTDLQVIWITKGFSKELKERYDLMNKYLSEKYPQYKQQNT